MPYSIRKLPNQDLYRVYNTGTKAIHSYATTLENAKKQVKLLHMVDAGVPLEKQGGAITDIDRTSTGVMRVKLNETAKKFLNDKLIPLITNTTIRITDSRKNSGVGRSQVFGYGNIRGKGFGEFKNNTNYPELYRALLIFGMKIVPDYIPFTAIQVNHNYKTKKHIDGNNIGLSLAVSFGDFTGGELVIGKSAYQTKEYPVIFNGALTEHFNKPIKGDRYSLVYFVNAPKKYSDAEVYALHKKTLSKIKLMEGEGLIGGSIETDRYEDKGEVSLPEFKSIQIDLPTYMYKRMPDIKGKPPPYKYKLVNPITETRTIASRKKEKAVDIKRKPIGMPNLTYEEADDFPIIDDFSPKDQEKLEEYYDEVKKNEKKDRNEIANQPANNLPRGFPITMYKTADRMGYKKTDEKVYKRKVVVEKPEKPRKEKTSGKPVGRPKSIRKQAVIEEEEPDDLFAKLTQGEVASRGSSRAPSKTSEKSVSEISSLSSLAKESEKSISTAKSSSKASSVKSSKSSSAGSSESGIDDDDLDAFLENQYKKKLGLGILGKGINKISNNSNMANSWITYVKEYAAKNGMSYRDALRDPDCKAGYKKGGVVKKGRGVVDEMGGQALLANTYNDSELGANAGKKFISL